MAIRIVTDSTADLSMELIEKYDIKVIPLTVNFEEESFLDGVEISPEKFFKKLKESKKLPSTSQINPGQFVDIFEKIIGNGDIVVGIFISSTLSGTYNSALIAKESINSENVLIFDSKTSSIQLGLVALEAAKVAKQGKAIEEVIDIIEFSLKNSKIIFMLDTLEYLKKGGRISSSKALMASLLNVKLIMTVEDGNITLMDKVRGRKKGVKWISDYINSQGIVLKNSTLAFVHGDDFENLKLLKETVSKTQDISGGDDYCMGAVIGTHLGPGSIGIGYINKN